jgi:hypothetical protein
LWFNQGSTIGCDHCSGNSGLPTAGPDCANPAEPTIKWTDKELRTYGFRPAGRLDDFTKYHPWRYPGSSPVVDPCGLAGGWYTTGSPYAGGDAPPGAQQGDSASKYPFNQKVFAQTTWIAGSEAEVAWGIEANHGGGYQYRLCPLTEYESSGEACFQTNPLQFVGDSQWIQFGHGMDVNNRTEIPATTVTGNKVVPVGSTWRRNPIPPCNTRITGGALKTACKKPAFEPPIPGLFGFGPGTCGSSIPFTSCNAEEFAQFNFDFGIVDKVQVPYLPEGDYVVSFRWDSEQTNQVWVSCADVTIKNSGAGTQPFSQGMDTTCEMCCPSMGLACSNCTTCVNDKTGACAYCWKPLPGYNPDYAPKMQCLGGEAPDGTAPKWYPGDEMMAAWSPGCQRCWSDESLCKPFARPEKQVVV